MKVVVDTNMVVYLRDRRSPVHPRARSALAYAAKAGDGITLVPQVIYELWAVLTRSIEKNGLGWAPARAEAAIRDLLVSLPLTPDSADLVSNWLTAVARSAITGKRSHDWRLAVAARLAGANAILTFNTSDLAGFEGLEILEPAVDRAG